MASTAAALGAAGLASTTMMINSTTTASLISTSTSSLPLTNSAPNMFDKMTDGNNNNLSPRTSSTHNMTPGDTDQNKTTSDLTRNEKPNEVVDTGEHLIWTKATWFTYFGKIPAARWGHTGSVIGSNIYIFGGTGLKIHNDIHYFDAQTSTWICPNTTGTPPAARFGHSTTAVGSRLYIFGGRGTSKLYNDLHIFDTETLEWTRFQPTKLFPEARAGHTTNLVGNHTLVVFGGHCHKQKYSNSVFLFDIATMRWTRPKVKGIPPSARGGHTSVIIGSLLFVFGGYDGVSYYNDLHVFCTRTFKWSKMENMGGVSPSPRSGHSATLIGKKLFVFGGCGEDGGFLNDMYILDTENMTWMSNYSVKGTIFTPRFRHSCNRVDNKLYIFGGAGANILYNDMYVLNVPHTSAVISSTVELFPPEQENETDATRQDFMQMYLSAVLSLKSEKDKRVSVEIEKDSLQLALQKEKDLRKTLEEEKSTAEAALLVEKEERKKDSLQTKRLQKKKTKAEAEKSKLEQVTKDLNAQLVDMEAKLNCLTKALAKMESEKREMESSLKKEQSSRMSAQREAEAALKVRQNSKSELMQSQNQKEQLNLKIARMSGDSLENLSVEELEDLEASQSAALIKISAARRKAQREKQDNLLATLSRLQQEKDVVEQEGKEAKLSLEMQNQKLVLAERERSELKVQNEQLKQKMSLRSPDGSRSSLHSLDMSELEELEHFHHEALKLVGVAKKEQLQKQLEDLRREKEQLLDQTMCVVCTERDISVVLMPCRHRCLCKECAPALKKCPICRTEIQQLLNTY